MTDDTVEAAVPAADPTMFGFLDQVDLPMFVVDAGGMITAWNRALQRQSGLEASALVQTMINDHASQQPQQRSLSELLEFATPWEVLLNSVLNEEMVSSSCKTDDASSCNVRLVRRCFFSAPIEDGVDDSEATTAMSRLIRIQLSACRDDASNAIVGALGIVSFPKSDDENGEGPAVSSTPPAAPRSNHNNSDRPVAQPHQPPILTDPETSSRYGSMLLEAGCCPVFVLNARGCMIEWNDAMAQATGRSSEVDSISQTNPIFVEQFVVPIYRDIFTETLTAVVTTGVGQAHVEVEVINKLTGPRSLLLSLNPLRENDGAATSMVICIAHDVTDSTKQNRAVGAVASELRQLLDTANAPIFGCDTLGNINEWNDMTAQITGFTKDEVADCSLIDTFIAPYMKDSVQDMLNDSLLGQSTPNFDLDLCTKLGDIRHLLVNTTTRRDADNNIVGVVAVAQDVTEAVLRDRAVAGMALELRQLIDTANAPIFGCDIDFNVNEWNRRTEEITGFLKEEAFGLPLVSTFIAPSMHGKVQDILLAALQGDETSNYELEIISKSGEPRLLLVNATTRRDPEGNIVGVVSVAQDATEDRKHAAELRKMQFLQATQQAKMETERNMTDYFAHELRNPLSAIDSALSAMPDDLPDSSRSLVTGMQLCVRFCSAIMDNLLDVRRMEEGKVVLAKSPFSLSALLAEVRGMVSPSIKPGVLFHTECDTAGRDWVVGDERRIQQMLTNVIANAVKYTLSGSITIHIRWENDTVQFSCIDTGPGISKSAQQNLFQRFVQRGGAPGTGLGLAIAKHLVDLAGGTILFDSDPSIAAGTTCTVHIPLTVCESPNVANREDKLHRVLEAPLRFLIIDDVKMNRTMLKRRIQKKICPRSTIAEAPTGERALEICGTEKFDVIIVDQYMEEAGGVMVGTDVVYAMRRMRIDSIIIGCSGNDLDVEFGEAGVDWVWQKPMPSNEDIIAHLHAALAAKHKI